MNISWDRISNTVKRYQTLIENLSYLSALQTFNLIIPLATYPYLIRVLGKDTYGLVVFAKAVASYLVIVVGFGFNISATKKVSNNRKDKKKLSEIVSCVLIIKGGLLVLSFIVMAIFIYFIPRADDHELLFYLSMWVCFYEWIFPIWYFQGLEKMKYITYFTLVSRLTFLGLIFLLITAPQHYLRLPLINGLGALLAGACSLYIIFIQHEINFQMQSVGRLKRYFIETIPLFVSGISVKIFVLTNKVVIGGSLGMAEVAYYDLADKVVNVLKKPQMILSQAIFPKTSKDKNLIFVKKMMFISFLGGLTLFLLAQIFAPTIVLILGGKDMQPAVNLLRILVITIPIVYISQYTIMHSLLANGYNKTWMKVVSASAIIYVALIVSFQFFSIISTKNMVYATLISELYVLVSTYYYSKRFKLL